jgi:hypothetical protein
MKGFSTDRLDLLSRLHKLNIIGTRVKALELAKVFHSLPQLHTVSFSITPEDGVTRIFNKVADALGRCEKLRKLTISCDEVMGSSVIGGIADILTTGGARLEVCSAAKSMCSCAALNPATLVP